MQPLATKLDHEAALRFLMSRIDYERTSAVPYGKRDFKLDRMRALVDRLGSPDAGMPIVHVAGTKGKGSTAAMIATILSSAGYRTGLYSSPHLDRVEERMAVDGRACSPSEFVELIERVQPVVAALDAEASLENPPASGPTYFEIITALALLHFAQREVDLAVLEVGLGGRLDSTNVCRPSVAVITSISFDHTKQLGNTLAAIAGEKAGIIKPGLPVISGVLHPEPRQVIESVARAHGCPLEQLGVDFEFDYRPPHSLQETTTGLLDFRHMAAESPYEYPNLPLRLLGVHQGANAAVALATIEALRRQGWKVPETAVRRGLAEVNWPARVEVLSNRPTIVLDAAHNVASIAALVGVLDQCGASPARLLVFATTQDKDVRGMLEQLLPKFDAVIFTRYLNNPRAVPPEKLAEMAAEIRQLPSCICMDPASAWEQARDWSTADHLVVITGSFFIAAEMRAAIHARPLQFATQ